MERWNIVRGRGGGREGSPAPLATSVKKHYNKP